MGEPSDRELERLFDLDEAAGPARPIDASRSAAIITAALRGAGFPSGGGSGGAAGAKSAIATRLALVAGGAAVVIGVTVWWLARAPARPAELSAPVPAASVPAAIVRAADPPPAAAPASAAAAAPVTDDEAAPEPGDPPPVPPAPPARTRPRPREHARVDAPRTPTEATDLLARANAARLVHDWRGADALYRRVARGGGGDGLAAQTALVASAELHLEHLGDPAGAARRFRAVLAGGPDAALAEDARWGLAESARVAGDAAAERRALDDFLAHHPASARAERARTRRAALGPAGAAGTHGADGADGADGAAGVAR